MAQYDGFADQYRQLVRQGSSAGTDMSFRYIEDQLLRLADVGGLSICDVGCGQGELSCRLALKGAQVTGVDLSAEQLDFARAESDRVRWVLDDAMHLQTLADESFDAVVSSLMLMDVPDHKEVFRASRRILKPGGLMIWVIMHPCFQSPFSRPLGDGSRQVSDYREQFWKSHGTGTIRSTLGAYHRPLSAYVNDFIAEGFALLRVDELDRPDQSIDALPGHFAAVGRKVEADSGKPEVGRIF